MTNTRSDKMIDNLKGAANNISAYVSNINNKKNLSEMITYCQTQYNNPNLIMRFITWYSRQHEDILVTLKMSVERAKDKVALSRAILDFFSGVGEWNPTSAKGLMLHALAKTCKNYNEENEKAYIFNWDNTSIIKEFGELVMDLCKLTVENKPRFVVKPASPSLQKISNELIKEKTKLVYQPTNIKKFDPKFLQLMGSQIIFRGATTKTNEPNQVSPQTSMSAANEINMIPITRELEQELEQEVVKPKKIIDCPKVSSTDMDNRKKFLMEFLQGKRPQPSDDDAPVVDAGLSLLHKGP